MQTPSAIESLNAAQPAAVVTARKAVYSICRYNSDAIPEILRLTRATLGNDGAVRKTEAFWRWKHEQSFFGQSYGLYAYDEQKHTAIGLRVLMRWQFGTSKGQTIRAARAVDTATHPSHQRRGIFSQLTRKAIADLQIEGVDLIYNTPNAKSLPGYLKMGWRVVARWPVYIRPLKPLRMLSRRIKLHKVSQTNLHFNDFFARRILTWQQFEKRYSGQISDLIADWEQQREKRGLRTPRTLDYLNWRYGRHPHLTYGVFALGDADNLEGFAILRPNVRFDWQEIVLAEIILKVNEIRFGKWFLQELIKNLRGDYLIAHFAENTDERKMIRRLGFFRAPAQGMTFTVNPLSAHGKIAHEAAGWDLTLGDLELF